MLNYWHLFPGLARLRPADNSHCHFRRVGNVIPAQRPYPALAAARLKLFGLLPAAWTAFGTLDLVAAIVPGAFSAPTPFHALTETLGTAAMGALPWVRVPALPAPVYLMIHPAVGRGRGLRRPGALPYLAGPRIVMS